MRTYSIRQRWTHDKREYWAVVVSIPDYLDGAFVQVGGRERWTFWESMDAWRDAQRRTDESNAQGKPAKLR